MTHTRGICSGFMEFSQIHVPLVDLQNVNRVAPVGACACAHVRVRLQGERALQKVSPDYETFPRIGHV